MTLTEPLNILIIDDNSEFVLSILRCFAGYSNFKVDVLLTKLNKPQSFRNSRYLRKIYREQINEDNFKSIVEEVVSKSSADLIIPTREWISKLLSKYKDSLEKIVKIQPVSDAKIIETVNDKRKLNQFLEDNNFPFAKIWQSSNGTSFIDLSDKLTYPVLLKPALSLGGKGIILINGGDNLITAVTDNKIPPDEYFIQEFIEGYDIGINIFAIDGKIYFHTIQKALFSGQLTYSRGIQFVKNKELLELTTEIVRKLNYTGVANLDLKYDSKRGIFVLVDFNARYWSTLDGSKFMGVNFPVIVTAYAMGIKIDPSDEYLTGTYYCSAAAIKTFLGNTLRKKKYPINLKHTKLSIILRDPFPGLILALELSVNYLKKLVHTG